MSGPARVARRRLRRACFAGIAVCYVVAIPWYRVGDGPPAIVAGLPDWVAVALGAYVLAGALNAAAWWLADVRDQAADAGDVGP